MPSKRSKKTEPKKGAWKDSKNKNTGASKKSPAKKTEANKKSEKQESRYIFMKTNYRAFARRGQLYKVDNEKADELVKLGRAEEYDSEKHSNAPKAN